MIILFTKKLGCEDIQLFETVNYLNSIAVLLRGGFIQPEDGSKMAAIEHS